MNKKREKILSRIDAWEQRGRAAKSTAGVRRAIDALDTIAQKAVEPALQMYALQSAGALHRVRMTIQRSQGHDRGRVVV